MVGRILLALGGLVVVALFAALVAPLFVDWSNFRVGFEEQASRALGKKVSVHGAVDARILPFPSVTLHDVRVGSDTDGQPQVQVARFSMDMELAPFLSGEVRIFDMRIEEPRARVRVLRDGTLDWMRGSRAGIAARHVVIEDVHVSDGVIDFVDEQSGRSRRLAGLSGEFSADSLQGPWRGEGNATLDGYKARFALSSGAAEAETSRMPLRLRLWPDRYPVALNLDGAVTLADNKPSYAGEFALETLQEEDESEPVEAPTPGPRVKGQFELTNDRIRIPQYRVEIGAPDNPYVVTGEGTLDTGQHPEFLLTADGQQIDVNQMGEGTSAKTGRDPLASARRRIDNFIQMVASIPIPQVPGRASLRLPAIVANDTTIRDVKLDVRPAGRGWAVDNVVATLPGRTRLEANGNLVLKDRVSFVGDMLVASSQPSGLADWLSGQVAPEIRQLGTAGFSAKVNLTPDLQRFDDFEVAMGAAILKGRVERQSLQGERPKLSVNLAGNEIDIDAMRALASLMTGDDAGDDVLDHQVAATLKADRLTAFGVAADRVDTTFTTAGGVLSLERLTIGDINGASLSASGKVEGSLLSYAGTATLRLRSGDPSGFFAMLRERLPRHPALERLASNGSWFANTELTANLEIGGDTAGLEIAVQGSSNGSTVEADLQLPRLFDLTGKDEMKFELAMGNPDSRILLGQAGLDPLPFEGDGAGRLTVSVPRISEGIAETAIVFDTGKTSFSLSGNVNIGEQSFGQGTGHLTLRSDDLEPYLLMNGIGMPQFGTGLPVRLGADVSMTAGEIKLLGLSATAAGNNFAGDLTFDRSAPGLPAAGSFRVDTVDLDWLAEAVFGRWETPETGALSSVPFAPPIFSNLDLAVDLHAGKFRAGQLGEITDFSATVTHRGGGIVVENGSGKWRDGKVAGRLMMSNGDGTGLLQLRLDARDADLSQLVWQHDERPVATGRLALDASVESTGTNMRELLAGASGSAELRVKGLVIDGLNLHALTPLMAEVDQLEGDVTEEAVFPLVTALLHEGIAEIGDLTIPLTITAGEARAQNIAAAVGSTKLSGEGRFSSIDDRMTADLAITYDAGEEGPPGGDPTVRLGFSGKLSEPRQATDIGAMTNFLSQRAFEQERRRVEALQASVMEKQRLRREAALYAHRASERKALREKTEAEERARREALAAERQRQAAEAAARVNDEAERSRSAGPRPFVLPPTDEVLQPDLPVVPSVEPPTTLPGVQP